METHTPKKQRRSRAPLAEVSPRVNSAPAESFPHPPKTYRNEKENVKAPFPSSSSALSQKTTERQADGPAGVNPRHPHGTVDDRDPTSSKRQSQISNSSASSQIKTHIGPWQLGKTLGKGSSARVRLARHKLSHQPVAVKIVPKKLAHITQAGSLAHLDQIDKVLPDTVDGVKRLPLTIEREIAILKLIEHPNIIKLYDMWENRNEIYLILEYVEGGDLFEYINTHGIMTEHDAVYVFRQMMCAMEYCHSYNICHRDLKPENILIQEDGTVKICDFGMGALHQSPDEKLRTSCGSPHYAAPEVLRNRPYKGDKADIWSMGVILFAMMAARLPFDEPDLRAMISKAKRGIYMMPKVLTDDARDLIDRILQVNPDNRISMAEMWEHPLIKKYDNTFGFEGQREQPVQIRSNEQFRPISHRELDPQILRQLRAMWHTLDEVVLIHKLTCKEPTEQKLFYHLLVSHRDRQLENYDPQLTHSASDYHHLRPPAWTTRVSTRQFRGHGRTTSRFTVISTVAETEGGTVRSYDPFYASRVMQPGQASHARITIHRNGSEHEAALSMHSGSQASRVGTGSRRRANSQLSRVTRRCQSPVSSLSSIQSSRQGTPSIRAKPHYKRGVDFSSVRKRPEDLARQSRDHARKAPASIAGDDTTYDRDNTSPQSPNSRKSKQPERAAAQTMADVRSIQEESTLWTDELLQFSNSIAKDCDDAFGSSLIESPSLEADASRRDSTPFSLSFGTSTLRKTPEPVLPAPGPAPVHPWDTRPLPPPPPRSESVLQEVMAARASRVMSDHGEEEDFSHLLYPGDDDTYDPSQTVQPLRLSKSGERRVVSAPVYAQYSRDSRHLPSIYENAPETPGQSRIVSAPQPRTSAPLPAPPENHGLEYLVAAEKTIRVVYSPSAQNYPGKSAIPEPLNVRKKFARGVSDIGPHGKSALALEVQSGRDHQDEPQDPQEEFPIRHTNNIVASALPKKKSSSWFKRSSKVSSRASSKEDVSENAAANTSPTLIKQSDSVQPSRTDSTSTAPAPPLQPAKKKSFLFPLWRSGKSEPKMSLAGSDYEETPSPEPKKRLRKHSSRATSAMWTEPLEHEQDNSGRKIEPQQNWFARLFRVKPATRYLCLTMSRRRARQEAAILLREWRRYGIRDIEVDKERNIIFARVSKRNFLRMKEVSFAIEIMTVIEHGKRVHLSIMRFTQEKGAASSFNKVIDTMEQVFTSRSLVVPDKRKRKMMIQTLNS